MSDIEYQTLEELINKLSIELKAPIFIGQTMNEGWHISRYEDANIRDSKSDFSIKSIAEFLIAADVTKKLIPHDIIG